MISNEVVGSGKYTYKPEYDWAKLPDGWSMPAAAVFGDSNDNVYCFNRDPDHRIMIFDKDGNYKNSWGGDEFTFPHAIWIDGEDNLWLTDRDNCQMYKYSKDGELLMTIGEKGYRSDTGADNTKFDSNSWIKVTHAGEPFNMPSGIMKNAEGEIFISDGYANCRVHAFSGAGDLKYSWGAPGSGPGEFHLPHGVWIDRKGRVLIADRENNRVQVFDQTGKWIKDWPTELIGAAVIYIDDGDIAYVCEHNSGQISVLTSEGELLARWGDMTNKSCHGIWADSNKDLYVVMPFEGSTGRTVVKYHRQ